MNRAIFGCAFCDKRKAEIEKLSNELSAAQTPVVQLLEAAERAESYGGSLIQLSIQLRNTVIEVLMHKNEKQKARHKRYVAYMQRKDAEARS
jgi:hypothetical protein